MQSGQGESGDQWGAGDGGGQGQPSGHWVDPAFIQQPQPAPPDAPSGGHGLLLPGPATTREQQMAELAYQAGRAQAMAEAAMHAANSARIMQTNVHVHPQLRAPQQPSAMDGCLHVVIILVLIGGIGVGWLVVPLSPVIGLGIIIAFAVGLIATIAVWAWG